MTDSKILRKIISFKGLKLGFIAKELEISPYALSKKINNLSEFKASEISKLCDILGIVDLKEKDNVFFAVKVD